MLCPTPCLGCGRGTARKAGRTGSEIMTAVFWEDYIRDVLEQVLVHGDLQFFQDLQGSGPDAQASSTTLNIEAFVAVVAG